MTTKTQQRRGEIADRLADGYAETPATRNRRSRDEKVGVGFRELPEMERLIALRQTDRATFDRAVRGRTLALGFYEERKAAYARLQGDDDA